MTSVLSLTRYRRLHARATDCDRFAAMSIEQQNAGWSAAKLMVPSSTSDRADRLWRRCVDGVRTRWIARPVDRPERWPHFPAAHAAWLVVRSERSSTRTERRIPERGIRKRSIGSSGLVVVTVRGDVVTTYVIHERRRQRAWIGAEGDRVIYTRALPGDLMTVAGQSCVRRVSRGVSGRATRPGNEYSALYQQAFDESRVDLGVQNVTEDQFDLIDETVDDCGKHRRSGDQVLGA
jgi:hypothetical protein